MVGFMEFLEFCIVDAVGFGNLGSSCFVAMFYWRRLFGAVIANVRDAGVVGHTTSDSTMSMAASTEGRGNGAGVGKDFLLEELNFGVIKVADNRSQSCMGKMSSAVIGRFVRGRSSVVFVGHG